MYDSCHYSGLVWALFPVTTMAGSGMAGCGNTGWLERLATLHNSHTTTPPHVHHTTDQHSLTWCVRGRLRCPRFPCVCHVSNNNSNDKSVRVFHSSEITLKCAVGDTGGVGITGW